MEIKKISAKRLIITSSIYVLGTLIEKDSIVYVSDPYRTSFNGNLDYASERVSIIDSNGSTICNVIRNSVDLDRVISNSKAI